MSKKDLELMSDLQDVLENGEVILCKNSTINLRTRSTQFCQNANGFWGTSIVKVSSPVSFSTYSPCRCAYASVPGA